MPRRAPGVGWLAPLGVALVTLAAFLPVLGNGFVDWDDDEYILGNPYVRGLGWREIRWMWTDSLFQGLYRPVALMTYGADYLLWGTAPLGYHLTSVLLHVANTLVFYFVARRLLALATTRARPAPDLSELGVAAGIAAVLFSVHPLRVEPVAWVSARADLVSSLFLLLSVAAYLRAVGGGGASRRGWQLASLGSFVLAAASKSSVIALPAILTLLDVYPLGRLGASPRRWLERVWWEKLPYWLVALAVFPLAFLAKRYAGAAGPLEEYNPALGAAKVVFAIPFHLWKTLAPVSLSPLYQSPPDARPWDPAFLVAGAAVIALTAVLVTLRRRWPAGLAAWLGYVILLLPACGFLSFGPLYAADRYTYVAGLGWALLAGGGALWAWRARKERRLGAGAFTGLTAAIVAAIVVLIPLSWSQARVWHDSLSLWGAVLVLDPGSSFAHNNLGLTLARAGQLDEAVAQYQQALRLAPVLAEAHNNLGLALGRQARAEQAVLHYREAIRLKPSLDRAHFNLGNALAERGEWTDAAEAFERAVALRPEFAEAQNNLGVVLMRQGRVAEAAKRFELALALRPGFREAQSNLEVARSQSGR